MAEFFISREDWIERYGGQSRLDAEGFDVVPCEHCTDAICHGWRVQSKPQPDPAEAERQSTVAKSATVRVAPGPAEAERKRAGGKAWEAVVIAASHVPGGDCARLVAEVTGDYLAMRAERDRLAAQSAALEELLAAGDVAEKFIADELAWRRESFLPDPTSHESGCISKAELALHLIHTALAKCREALK